MDDLVLVTEFYVNFIVSIDSGFVCVSFLIFVFSKPSLQTDIGY